MQVLVLLAAHAGQVVAKERLIRTVWPDAFVTDDVLTRAISELRRVFGDDAKEPRFIQTIPKSGYRLIAAVSPVAVPSSSVPIVTPAEMVLPPPPALPHRTRTGSALAFTQSWRGRLIAGVLALALVALVTRVWQRTGRPGLYVARNSPAVSELLHKGTFYRSRWSEAEIRKAIDYYNRAIGLDPNAIDAYNGLASAWTILSDLHVSPRDAMPHARAAAEQVLRRDEASAAPHISLGVIKLQYDWDFAGADREFARAMELEPDNIDGRVFRGWLRMAEGRLPAAQADMQRAVDKDPSSWLNLWSLGLSFYFAGEYDAAIEQYRRAIASEPQSYWVHLSLGWAYERQGRVADAIEELDLTRRLLDTPQVVAALVHAQAAAGRRVEAQATMTSLLEYAKRKYVSPYDVATAYAGLGDRNETLAWLEKAYEDRCGWLALWLKIDPTFDSMRADDRFRDLLTRVGHTP